MQESDEQIDQRRLQFLKQSVLAFLFTLGVSPLLAYQVCSWLAVLRWNLKMGETRIPGFFWLIHHEELILLSIPAFFTTISIILLMLSVPRGPCRWKILLLPFSFFLTMALGCYLRHDVLMLVGLVCLAAAPSWLGEIFRVRALKMGLVRSSTAFFVHHFLAGLCLLALYRSWNGSYCGGLAFLWWSGFLVALSLFWWELNFELRLPEENSAT